MFPIQINGNEVDIAPPLSGLPQALHFDFAPEAAIVTNYFLLQTKEPVHAPEKAQLAANNIQIQEVVARNTYLCGYKDKEGATKPSVDEIRSNLNSFVVFADVYRPEFVVEKGLKSAGDNPATVSVDILAHEDVDVESLVDRVATEAGIPPEDVQALGGKLRISLPQAKLASVAAIDEVRTINAVPIFRAFNNRAKTIMNVHEPVGPKADKFFKGAGQIVCVADTGFDTGNEAHCHEAFGDRVLKVLPLGRPGVGRGDDPDGHGTHVCGSVLGKGSHKTEGEIEAPASESKLVMQSLFDRFRKKHEDDPASEWQAGFGGIPKSGISTLFAQAVDHGASVHTNSWGSFPDLEPRATRAEIDGFRAGITKDIDSYLRRDRNLVVLFAAGNSGADVDRFPGRVDPGSIGAEATSKNVITVGASENNRPDAKYPAHPRVWRDFGYKSAPLAADNVANNPEGLAAFSSRGPTKPDARFKPDVVAPGTTILSTRSSKIDPPEHFTDDWGISKDEKWCFQGGTSMATPLVAGCCAVIRGAMVDTFPTKKPPVSTAIKAVLINGAVPLEGQYPVREFGPPPNADYGFGRVDLKNSLLHVVPEKAGTAGYGTGPALADNGVDQREWKKTIVVPEAGWKEGGKLTLKVTVTWADVPSPALVNDLDLSVSDGEEVRLGNGGPRPDRVNNVEQVTWEGVEPGKKYVVKVEAFSIPRDDFPQDFSYAWRIFESS